MNQEMPLVDKNDDGIRLAGKPDECFYCRQKIGFPHLEYCVIVEKRVKINFIVTLEIDVPHSWNEKDIEFRFNGSSWCADNLIHMMDKASIGGCLCGRVRAEYIETIDETPRRGLAEINHVKPRL